eukprot:TRINITY_DN18744_c0_g2_i6.p5 TRINITY_DN18744_c0_g2~~TRINITY_DN18744_c0_g2_i6.p5  ORF type:complete len:131 (-),score=0.73 TRINITY_DN18744_c0_g2_i6:2017-2409(-)
MFKIYTFFSIVYYTQKNFHIFNVHIFACLLVNYIRKLFCRVDEKKIKVVQSDSKIWKTLEFSFLKLVFQISFLAFLIKLSKITCIQIVTLWVEHKFECEPKNFIFGETHFCSCKVIILYALFMMQDKFFF